MTVERQIAARAGAAGVAAADAGGGGADGADDRARGAAAKIPGIDALITWIPGEVIAAYSAVVLALQPAADTKSPIRNAPLGWLIGAVLLACVLSWLGAWSKSVDLTQAQVREAAARALFAGVAFAIWSFVVPASWWYSRKWAADNATVIPIAAGIVGLVFSLFAEGIVRRLGGTVD